MFESNFANYTMQNKNLASKGVVAIIFIYIAANIYSAASALLNNGKFTGSDFEGFKIDIFPLLLNLCLVIIIYILSIFLYFGLQRKSDITSIKNLDIRFLGWIVLSIQIIYLWSLTFGGVTLEQLKNESSFATYFQTLFVPDYAFLVYYALGRESKLFFPNLALYLSSTLLRGMAGGFVFLIFFELVYSFKRSNWQFLKVILFSLVFLSPCIYEIRKMIRSASSDYLLTTPVTELLFNIIDNAYTDINFIDALLDMINLVFMRLQHLSSSVAIFDHLDDFWLGDTKGHFLSFMLEGTPQSTILGGGNNLPLLSQYITTTLLPTPFGSWFIHPSLAGWLWVNPYEFPVLIGYCIFLCALNMFLVRKLGGRDYAIACSFVIFVILIMNGWFGPYISTIQALAILWFLTNCIKLLRKFVI